MLRARVLTAFVLLLLLAAALWVPFAWAMPSLLSVMIGCALWEWLRMLKWRVLASWILAGAATVFMIGASAFAGESAPGFNRFFQAFVIPLALGFWLIVAPFSLARGRLDLPAAVLAPAAFLVLGAAWYALVWVFVRHGASALISLWALVWCADTAAYFVGRRFGRHKLAPRISPGKTWEGAIGGVLGAVLWMVLTAIAWDGSYGSLLHARLSWPGVIGVAGGLAVASIAGDLFESLLKRRAGVKDSSRLLPGHGGVYDRIDALLPVAPAAVILLMFF